MLDEALDFPGLPPGKGLWCRVGAVCAALSLALLWSLTQSVVYGAEQPAPTAPPAVPPPAPVAQPPVTPAAAPVSSAPVTPAAAPASPAAPAPEAAPAAPPAEERPKIRNWLEEPNAPATPGAPTTPGASTAPVAVPYGPPATTVIEPPRIVQRDLKGRPIRDRDTAPPASTGAEPLPGLVDSDGDDDDEVTGRRVQMKAEFKFKLEEARRAYKSGDFQRAEQIARNILTVDPRNVAAAEMIRNARGRMLDADEQIAEVASERRDREALLESTEAAVRPPPRVPMVRPHLPRRDEDPETSRHKKMAEKLEQRVTFDFMKADLEWVLNSLFILTGVNIIADQAALEGKSLTLHVEDLPLREVLNFIVRNNSGIQFSVTEDAVWITAQEKDDLKSLMYPKVYPLHHGLVNSEAASGATTGQRALGTGGGGSSGGGVGGVGGIGGGSGGGGSSRAPSPGGGQKGGAAGGEPTYIEQVLKWMKDVKNSNVFPEGSDYLIDRESNQLIVFTTPAGHDRMSKFLDYFDQPAIQVLIKTRFLDISSENEKSLGLNLDRLQTRIGGVNSTGTASSTDTTTSTAVGTTDFPPGGQPNPFKRFNFNGGTAPLGIPGNIGPGNVLTLVGRRTDPQFQITIAALLNSSHTKILSEPQVLAINNKEAVIDVSTHFKYITNLEPIQSTTAAGNGTAVQSVSAYIPQFGDEEVGFTLTVTPSVGRDLKTINMHLEPVIDSLSPGETIQSFQTYNLSSNNSTQPAITQPTIDRTSVVTDCVMEDNGYIILGGLMQYRVETQQRKVPGLSSIPVMGGLFKSTSTDVTKRNLLVIVEAQIVNMNGRTYYKDPTPDDADPREGGSNHAPMQVSDVQRSDVINTALGLPAKPVTPHKPLTPQDARTNPGSPHSPNPLRNTPNQPNLPSQEDGSSAIVSAPATAPALAKSAAQPAKEIPAAENPRVAMTPRERMERLARTLRSTSTYNTPALSGTQGAGWSVSPEEPVKPAAAAEDATPAPANGIVPAPQTQGEVITPGK